MIKLKKFKVSKFNKIFLISCICAIAVFLIIVSTSCSKAQRRAPSEYLNNYANVFGGSESVGHTSPCATVPMEMIKVGPESGNIEDKYCAGYQYSDSELYGFSQNRLNGTGKPDLGDLHVFPFSGNWQKSEYKSSYNKETEKGEPGYYEVRLEDAKVNAQMTCTSHVSFERFFYDDPSKANLMIDFQTGLVSKEEELYKKLHNSGATQNFEDPYHISGNANTIVWVDRWYYYAIEFDSPYTIKEELPLRDKNEQAHRYILSFNLKEGQALNVKMSISRKSIANARENIKNELPDWNFDQSKLNAQNKWNEIFNRVNITANEDKKLMFYSSMYRLFFQPDNIGDSTERPTYSTLSLWDTFRAAHPLYTILDSEDINDFVNSMLDEYDREQHLPYWSLWGIDALCMVGNHAIPVIVDAYLKGYDGFDAERAYQAIKTSITVSHTDSDWDEYDQYGYFPYDNVNQDVSRTLECAYDDYCASIMADKLGHKDDAEFFKNRSNYYKNLWDPESKFVRPKNKLGNWREPFSPFDYYVPNTNKKERDFTEGNSWQYTFHVMQDIPGLIDLFGGNDAFCERLDKFFTTDDNVTDPKDRPKEVTGLIGQYCQGNEPCHHVAYLYTLAGQPWKTQQLINQICKTKYNNGVDGLCGNEDCGAMSAWYIFSVLGFYPVNPCGGEYIIGAPQIEEALINLNNGKTFTMKANNFGEKNIYVESVSFNGKEITDWKIQHKDIMNGGELVFNMTDKNPQQ